MTGREDMRPLICPRCNKPLVDFSALPPGETGTTCNPINSPKCWRKTPLREQKEAVTGREDVR